jgi:hypothetical protein
MGFVSDEQENKLLSAK